MFSWFKKMLTMLIFFMLSVTLSATTCPDPQTSSLQWGKVPAPWLVDPFSEHAPQGEKGAQFVRANILVAGWGRGVVCNYRNSIGFYSIWWPIGVSIPTRADYDWRINLLGFECTTSLESCVFHTADNKPEP